MDRPQDIPSFFEKIRSLLIDGREATLMARQRLSIFYATILVTCCFTPIYIWRFSYVSQAVIMIDVAMLFLSFISLLLYLGRRITVNQAIYVVMTMVQVGLGAEIVVQSTFQDDYVRATMLVNMLMSVLFFVLTCCAYMKYFPVWIGLIGFFSAYVSLVAMKAVFVPVWMLVVAAVYVSCLILSYVLRGNMIKTMEDNALLQEEESQLLNYLHINHDELIAFIRFFKDGQDSDSENKLMNTIGKEAKARIYSVVKAQMKEDMSRADMLEKVFPELTPSQREIAQLILQDKPVSEIAETLFKSVGNITSQRTHIRAKLGLKKEDNLKDALSVRMAEYAGTAGVPEA